VLRESVQGQPTLPAYAAVGAPQPGDTPRGILHGHLEDTAGEAGTVTMLDQVPLEALDEIADG
jgi:hypothetical protein